MSNLPVLVQSARVAVDLPSVDEGLVEKGLKWVFGKLRKIADKNAARRKGTSASRAPAGKTKRGASSSAPKPRPRVSAAPTAKRKAAQPTAKKKAAAKRLSKAEFAKKRAEYMKEKPWEKKSAPEKKAPAKRGKSELQKELGTAKSEKMKAHKERMAASKKRVAAMKQSARELRKVSKSLKKTTAGLKKVSKAAKKSSKKKTKGEETAMSMRTLIESARQAADLEENALKAFGTTEQELFDFLKGPNSKRVSVSELVYAFGGEPTSWAKALKKLVDAGKLGRTFHKQSKTYVYHLPVGGKAAPEIKNAINKWATKWNSIAKTVDYYLNVGVDYRRTNILIFTVDKSGNRSALYFVDPATGDLLRPDGWKKPSKNVHGNIFKTDPADILKMRGAYLKKKPPEPTPTPVNKQQQPVKAPIGSPPKQKVPHLTLIKGGRWGESIQRLRELLGEGLEESMQSKKWYKMHLNFGDEDIYFYAVAPTKAGGFAGMQVSAPYGKARGKAIKTTVTKFDFRVYQEVPEGEVPAKVKQKVQDRIGDFSFEPKPVVSKPNPTLKPTGPLTDKERAALKVILGYKAFARGEYMKQKAPGVEYHYGDPTIQSLAARGILKISKTGSIQAIRPAAEKAMKESLDEAAKPVGKAQVAIYNKLKTAGPGNYVKLTDFRGGDFHGIHFKQIMKGAETLVKKGLAKHKAGEPGREGDMYALAEEVMVEENKKLRSKILAYVKKHASESDPIEVDAIAADEAFSDFSADEIEAEITAMIKSGTLKTSQEEEANVDEACGKKLHKLAKKSKKQEEPMESVDFTSANVSLDRIRVELEDKVLSTEGVELDELSAVKRARRAGVKGSSRVAKMAKSIRSREAASALKKRKKSGKVRSMFAKPDDEGEKKLAPGEKMVFGRKVKVEDADLDEAKKKKSMEPGGGGRFAAMVQKLKKRGDVEDPAAVAAAIGRKKYGKEKFQKMAAKGRARARGG